LAFCVLNIRVAWVNLEISNHANLTMHPLYPLRFEPLVKRYLWGGRRLESVLGKQLPEGDDFAESWEIVDHGQDQSRVADGPLKGITLKELVDNRGAELLGRHAPQARFPLLFKYLDSSKVLSVQVHPNDAAAARLIPPDLGKTEAWLVLHAEPGAVVYAGLKRGVDRSQLQRATESSSVEECLHQFQPRVGDCLFIPAGVVHALGAGFVIAEIQQASNTTYRLHDWNRVGPDGKPRALHIEESLETIDYDFGPVSPQVPTAAGATGVERLVSCDKFVLDRWQLGAPSVICGDERFHIVSVLQGRVQVAGDPMNQPVLKGQTVLLPAAIGAVELVSDGLAVILDMYLP
jgi:mannose-6-phosphate isomerase